MIQCSMLLEGNYLVPCASGIKLQSLRSVRLWTSLVRNCLNYAAMSTRTRGNGILAIDLAVSNQLETKQNKYQILVSKSIKRRSLDHIFTE